MSQSQTLPESKCIASKGLARAIAVLMLATWVVGGCVQAPTLIPADARTVIDRKVVEYPKGFLLKVAARGITAPTAIAFVEEEGAYYHSMLVAESGEGGTQPRIYGWKPDGTRFDVFPRGQQIPSFGLFNAPGGIYGPIGGMAVSGGKVFITHYDREGHGVVSSIGFDGSIKTIVGGLPAQGEHGLTDITVQPSTGRLWFGLGSATNSGVVGLDDWEIGWVKRHPTFCDLPPVKLKLYGFRFDTTNPNAGIFGGNDTAVTGPFQPFGTSNQLRIPKAPGDRPTAAIFSISPSGGDLHLEAHGIRYPRGLRFNEYDFIFATNDGMELRGTRPIKEDPDSLIKIVPNTWYGWPDYSTDLLPISQERFQPPLQMIIRSTSEVSAVVDRDASGDKGLLDPSNYRDTLLYGSFQWQSGAAKLDFVPASPGFRDFRGNAIVALNGDQSPFSNDKRKLPIDVGYKVMRVDMDAKRVEEFVHNTLNMPASKMRGYPDALERPIDVKFGPDGRLYILDSGKMEIRRGKPEISPGTGRIFILEPDQAPPTTKP